MREPLSLRLRIALMLLLAEFLLLAVFATGTFLFTQRRLVKSFDSSLAGNAEALATLVSQETDEGGIEIEFSDNLMERFSRRERPDVFVLLAADGSVIGQSRSLEGIPGWVKPSKSRRFRDFEAFGKSYRGVLVPARTQLEDGGPDAEGPAITVFFAANRDDLDDDLSDILEFLCIAAGITMVLSIGAAFWIAGHSLAPLRRLAVDTGKIDASSLDRRFDLKTLPPDLRQFAGSFNDLLARIGDSFERERRFSSDAAHELRTPVAVLKSGIQSALLSEPDATKDREALVDLLEDVARIELLCESLLLLGRSEAVDDPVPRISAAELVHQARAVVSSFPDSAAIQLIAEGRESGDFRADVATTRRILTNLIDNALRHGGATVLVCVDTGSGMGDAARISVEDDGPGVSADFEPRLFQRFARSDESRARSTGGAGLGLAISKGLAERLGGTLALAASETLRGACFAWRIEAAGEQSQAH